MQLRTKETHVFYGPGGVGKSRVMNIIRVLLGTDVTTIAPYVFAFDSTARYKQQINTLELLKAASSRLVVCNDLDITNDNAEVNVQSIKAITGGDYQDRVTVKTNVIASSNINPCQSHGRLKIRKGSWIRVVCVTCHDKRYSLSILLPLMMKPPDLGVESWKVYLFLHVYLFCKVEKLLPLA